MIPSSKIKNELKKKMKFDKEINENNTALAGKEEGRVNDVILAPDKVTPGSTSILSFLKTKTTQKKNSDFESMNPIKYYYYNRYNPLNRFVLRTCRLFFSSLCFAPAVDLCFAPAVCFF